jgi:hypothetical protein
MVIKVHNYSNNIRFYNSFTYIPYTIYYSNITEGTVFASSLAIKTLFHCYELFVTVISVALGRGLVNNEGYARHRVEYIIGIIHVSAGHVPRV